MAPPTSTLSKGWTDTIDQAVDDKRWDDHDDTIRKAIGSYTGNLSATPGYTQPDFKLIKAMLWTESGGPDNGAWSTKPLQIGVGSDPGLGALLDTAGRGNLIMPTAFQTSITKTTAKTTAAVNIQAAIGYLLLRHASFAFVSVQDAGATSEYPVVAGDSLSKIAKKKKTTIDEIKAQNPKAAKVIHVGDKLQIQPAHMEWQISGWSAVSTRSAAKLYNGGGDDKYAEKLDYCLALMPKLKR